MSDCSSQRSRGRLSCLDFWMIEPVEDSFRYAKPLCDGRSIGRRCVRWDLVAKKKTVHALIRLPNQYYGRSQTISAPRNRFLENVSARYVVFVLSPAQPQSDFLRGVHALHGSCLTSSTTRQWNASSARIHKGLAYPRQMGTKSPRLQASLLSTVIICLSLF